MADSSTTNLGLTLPEVDVSTTWPEAINANFETIDALMEDVTFQNVDGVTRVRIKNGSGQDWRPFEVMTAAGEVMAAVEPDGSINAYDGSQLRTASLLNGGALIASTGAVSFKSGAHLDTGAIDANITRAAAGRLKVGDGSGNARDLELRKLKRTAVSVSYGATPDFDMSLGELYSITLTGNAAATRSNPTAGHRVVVKVVQDATGGRTWSWPAEFLGGMNVGTDPNDISIQEFECFDGTNYEAVSMGVLR